MMKNLQSSAFVAKTTQLLSSVANLRLLLVMFLTLTVSAEVWGADVVYKTAKFGSSYNSGKVSSYTSSWYSTYDDFRVDIVNANNNNNSWSYIKMGSKNAASTGTITTHDKIDAAITKVSLEIDAITANNITSITLKTATSSDGTYTSVGTFTKATGSQTVTLTSPTANLFYKIEVVCTKGSSNGLITISQVDYYKSDVVATPEYNITYTGDEHITYTGTKPETIKKEDSGFELEFSVDDGYQLNDIQVKMGGQDLVVDEDYLWEEGYLLILPETDITGDIEIIFETVATCTNPTIATQPTGATYTTGATATALKVVASGDDLTYQWYSNTSNSTSGATAINGATNTTYTPSTSTVGTKYYYCMVSSGSCSTTSNIVSVVVKNPPFTVTLNAGSGSCAASVTESSSGAGVTLPTPTLTGCDEWTFAGWATASVGTETTTKPTLIASGTYKPTSNITLYAVYQRTETTEGVETTTITTDKLTRETTGVTSGSTTYTDWSDKTVTSKAVYAGNSAGSNNSIQLRSKNSNSGVITTKSGGKAKKVTVVWQSSTSSGRTLDIYGKNSAYSAATELYSTSTQGTKLGSIVKGTSTTLTITGDYEYIGLRSNSDAMYLTSISIDWATTTAGGTTITTYYHSTPECSTETLVSVLPKIMNFWQSIFGVSLGYLRDKTGYRHVLGGIVVVSLHHRCTKIDFHHINMSRTAFVGLCLFVWQTTERFFV